MNILRNFFIKVKQNNSLYIMLLPVFIGFILFQYIPIFYSVIIAFKDYSIINGLLRSPWVGIKYFIQFFNDPFFFRLVRNTVILGLYTFLWSFPVPIIIALLLNEVRRNFYKRFVQTAVFLPYFINLVVIIGIVFSLLSSGGVITNLLKNVGFEHINFISNPKFFRSLYITTEIWQKSGWASVIYLAALAGVRQELYEAAIVDGANKWQQMWHISISEIRPTIVFLLIWTVGNMLNVSFEKVILMYSPATYSTSDIIQTYVYRRGILGSEYGYGGAVSLFNSVIAIILLLIVNSVNKKTTGESLW
ncbi:MAG: ABC transporter permease subunit [Actinobacteria bacterium]|nr:ABC transporter permease subunit [Actinomycetota bacterium]